MFPIWGWLDEWVRFVLKLPAAIKGLQVCVSLLLFCFIFCCLYLCLPRRICTGVSEHIPIVLLVGIRPLIEVTKASGSYSHSNKDISFPWAGFINYAFLLQDLYFRVGIRMHAQFLPQWKGCWPPATSPLQLPPRQLIEQRSVAWRILILPYLCIHISEMRTYTAHCWWCCVPVCLSGCAIFFLCALHAPTSCH